MPARTIDLRSDTVTKPSPEMREALYRAELGDDVYGEDPDVNRLEELAAEKMGKDAAVLVTSGTQGNLVGVLSHCQRGDEVVVGDQAHILHYEVAGVAALGGVQLRPVPNGRGLPDPRDVEHVIRGQNVHYPPTRLLCLENTHNRASGAVFSAEQMGSVIAVARRHGLLVHLDGARIFNAAVALGVEAKELTREVDSVTFCLSKGLAAPVGSLLCGSREYIQRARKIRKMVGGGLRQAGIIAAPGLVALRTMVDRLAEDHDNARLLAEGLAELPGIILDPRAIQSNIVIFDLAEGVTTGSFLGRIRQEGILANATAPQRIRMVTHYGITADDVRSALLACSRALRG